MPGLFARSAVGDVLDMAELITVVMSELPLLHACITPPELNQHLEQLAKQTSAACVFPKVISFYNDMDRRNWKSDTFAAVLVCFARCSKC